MLFRIAVTAALIIQALGMGVWIGGSVALNFGARAGLVTGLLVALGHVVAFVIIAGPDLYGWRRADRTEKPDRPLRFRA